MLVEELLRIGEGVTLQLLFDQGKEGRLIVDDLAAAAQGACRNRVVSKEEHGFLVIEKIVAHGGKIA